MSYLALKLTHYGPPESSLKLVECEEETPGLEEAVIHVDAVGTVSYTHLTLPTKA